MIRTLILGFFVFALTAGPAAAACMGPHVAISHVGVQSRSSANGENRYRIIITVTNNGSMSQPSNVLQFVNIYDANSNTKLDARGIGPIPIAGTTHVTYDWFRASDAGVGTTTLSFRMNIVQGNTCSSTGSMSLTL